MKSEKFSIASVAKVVEGKLGRPVQPMKDPVSSKVEVACDEPAPGKVILLENSRLYIEEEGKGKDAGGNKTRANPEKVKELQASLATMVNIDPAIFRHAWRGTC